MAPTVLVSSNITAKTAACIGFWSPDERRKKTEAAHPESLPGTHQPTRTQPAVWDSSSHHCPLDRRACGRLPPLISTLAPARPDDVLEFDEAWSFVRKRRNKRWLWTVMCRRTRQLVAFVIGDRSEQSCLRLWDKVPLAYRPCLSYSDFWKAYQEVLPQETHCAVGKGSGQVSHMERWYCTLRQRQARICPQNTLILKERYLPSYGHQLVYH